MEIYFCTKTNRLTVDEITELPVVAKKLNLAGKWCRDDHLVIPPSFINYLPMGYKPIRNEEIFELMLKRRRLTGVLGLPEEAENWHKAFVKESVEQHRPLQDKIVAVVQANPGIRYIGICKILKNNYSNATMQAVKAGRIKREKVGGTVRFYPVE